MADLSKIEHDHLDADVLPLSLLVSFPKGVAVLWVDEELTAAIPATAEQTDQLADLTGKPSEYAKLRDELCAPHGYKLLLNLFRTEMEKVRKAEESARLN